MASLQIKTSKEAKLLIQGTPQNQTYRCFGRPVEPLRATLTLTLYPPKGAVEKRYPQYLLRSTVTKCLKAAASSATPRRSGGCGWRLRPVYSAAAYIHGGPRIDVWGHRKPIYEKSLKNEWKETATHNPNAHGMF